MIKFEGEDYVLGEAAIGAVGWMQIVILRMNAKARMINIVVVFILKGFIWG
jgi:hypothetical protein